MTRTLARPTPTPPPAGRTRRVLRTLTEIACLPYIGLKVAWVAGSDLGIPAGSPLLEHRTLLIVANSVSVVADALVVVLALLLTQPWGLRVRPWLLALPMWAATGLLTPIMIGFPAQLATALFTGPSEPTAGGEPFLDTWVFGVVYGGFIVQGLTLGTLFVLYTRDRWGHLWHGTVGDVPARLLGAGARATAVAAALLALAPAAVRLAWALGADQGLSAGQIADRTADFHVLQWAQLLLIGAAVTGVLLLAFSRSRALPVRSVLAVAWVGSGAVGCWGAYMSLVAAVPDGDAARTFTDLARLTYAGEMITGVLAAGVTAVFLRRRDAGA
ncbi:hypothetical protein [Streptomyces sp. NPDC048338]|uniref:hypothetical protein n=1 Tax=Streptomyces sp. NPDC048338 TaxID=3365536 RepID=UPI003724C152